MINQLTKNTPTHTNQLRNTLVMLYIIITVAIYTLPALKFSLPYIPVAITMLITIPLFMLIDKEFFDYSILLLISSGFLMLVIYIAGLSPVDSINEAVRNIRFFLPIMWGMFALKFCDRKICGVVIFSAVILFAYITTNTLSALAEDPLIVRELAKGVGNSTSYLNSYHMRNIGGFGFSYMMGLVTLCAVWSALYAHQKAVKIISLVVAIACFYFVLQTLYTTLLILTFAGTLILIILKNKNPLVSFLLILGGIFILLSFESILEWISTLFPNGSLFEEKFSSMHDAIANDDLSEVGSRPELILTALERWLKNPILGNISADANSHSLMIGMLEQTGIVGFGTWISLFVGSYFMLKKQLLSNKCDTMLFSVAFIYVLALSFFNPIGYVFEVTIVAFFIVPLWIKINTVNKGDTLPL